MARIKTVSEFVETVASTAAIVPPIPDHVSGDMILVFAVADGAALTAFGTTGSSAGWTIGGQQQSAGATTTACRAGWFWNLADSAAETLTITCGTSTTWCITIIVIEGAHASTPIDVDNGNGILISANPASTFQAASVNTVNANALVFWTMFNSLSTPSPYPGVRTVSAHDTGAIGLGIGMIPQVGTGATGTLNFYTELHTSTSQNSVSFTVAVRDAATPVNMPAYLPKTHAALLTPFRGLGPSTYGEVNNATDTNLFTNLPSLGLSQSKAVFHYDDSLTTFADVTTAANNDTTADLTLLNASPAANDYIALCSDSPFASISLLCSTTGVGGVFLCEVLNGSTWTSLDTVSTSLICWKHYVTTTLTNKIDTSFITTAPHSLYLTPAAHRKIRGLWKVSTLNSVSGYWMRLRYTTAPSTNPILSWIRPSDGICIYDAMAAAIDAGGNPFHNSYNSTPAIHSATISGPGGSYMTLGTGIGPYTPASKYLVGTYTFALARDYVDTGARGELGGIAMYFADSSWRHRYYYIGAYQSKDTFQNGRNVYAIQWSAATKTYGVGPTDPTTISVAGIAQRQIRGTGADQFNQLVAYDIPIVSGGTSANPITNAEFFNTFAIDYYYPLPLIQGGVSVIPIQLGGGNALFIVLDTFLMSFAHLTTEPYAFNASVYTGIHADANYLGLIFDARSGDVCKITNSVISSESSWRFEVLATASASATWSFSGSKFINASGSLRAVYTWDNISWQDCSSFITNGATITNSTFTNTKVTVASPAQAALISNSDFTIGTTGHAIEIGGTAADFTLTGNTFNGYSGTGVNAAIYVNIAFGTVNITIAGGVPSPSVRTAGATVNVINNVTITFTGMKDNTEVRVYAAGTSTELAGIENATAGSSDNRSFAASVAASTSVDYTLINVLYEIIRVENFTWPTVDQNLAIQQRFDRNNLNPP